MNNLANIGAARVQAQIGAARVQAKIGAARVQAKIGAALLKPNTHFKDPSEYEHRREKLEEYGMDDINDDHVGVTTILDSRKGKQRRRRTTILRS